LCTRSPTPVGQALASESDQSDGAVATVNSEPTSAIAAGAAVGAVLVLLVVGGLVVVALRLTRSSKRNVINNATMKWSTDGDELALAESVPALDWDGFTVDDVPATFNNAEEPESDRLYMPLTWDNNFDFVEKLHPLDGGSAVNARDVDRPTNSAMVPHDMAQPQSTSQCVGNGVDQHSNGRTNVAVVLDWRSEPIAQSVDHHVV
jgi:hypothetical protein